MQSIKCEDEWIVGLENQVIEPFPVADLGYLGLSDFGTVLPCQKLFFQGISFTR
jgi:hypothetical protein